MKLIASASAVLLFSSCVHTTKIQRPFSKVSIEKEHHVESISMEDVNSGNDSFHRSKAKELGVSYVDYLHMINNRKLNVIKSEPVIYHKHR